MGLNVIPTKYYTLCFDGCVRGRTLVKKDKDGLQRGKGAGGWLIKKPTGELLLEDQKPWRVPVSSNESELLALIEGLKAAKLAGIEWLRVFGDSQLALKTCFGEWRAHKEHLKPLVAKAQSLICHWGKKIKWDWRPRTHELCQRADQLAEIGYLLAPKTIRGMKMKRKHIKDRPLDVGGVRGAHAGSKSVRVLR